MAAKRYFFNIFLNLRASAEKPARTSLYSFLIFFGSLKYASISNVIFLCSSSGPTYKINFSFDSRQLNSFEGLNFVKSIPL